MEKEKTSVFSNALIWFGAGVSIAEILTGTLLAPLGFRKGLLAILLGHLIGCGLFYFAGLIGAKTGKSAMETVKISFGQKGSYLFSVANVLQLIGWTAVMIVSGTTAANSVINLGTSWIWSLAIGILVLLWVSVGLKTLGKLNTIAMAALFVLTLILSRVIFSGNASPTFTETLSFGAAVELSVAMPLSWLPLISDYTRDAEKPKKTTLVSTLVYGLVSCWMYVIGMGAAIFTGESDIGKIMVASGFGLVALLIIIFSTVTTTFLDVYSAGVSAESISAKLKEKPVAIFATIIGTVLAIFAPMSQYENFLYFISSIFVPMIAILIIDFFVLKKDSSSETWNKKNLFIWFVGFILYRIFMRINTPIGNTFPVMIITGLLCFITNKRNKTIN